MIPTLLTFPTAQTSFAETADIPLRALFANGPGVGVGTTDQLKPLKCSMRPLSVIWLLVYPTAHTSTEDTGATAWRMFRAARVLGLGVTDHPTGVED
jgi:hypothetical protein